MSDNQPQNIVDIARKLTEAIKAKDAKALKQIIAAYGDMYKRLLPRIEVLTLKMAEGLTAGELRRLDQYKELIISIDKELTKFSGYAETVMRTASNDAIRSGLSSAKILTVASNPEVTAGFRNLNTNVVQTLVGYFQDGSPLMKRLDKLAGSNALNVANTIMDNIALGDNPKVIAGLIRNSLGGGLTDALRMTRTVQLYSYREANRASYIANSDIVPGWYWFSELGPTTCLSCAAMHGTFHTNDEVLNDHHNGFCTSIPAVVGAKNPFEDNAGQKWFDSLSPEDQASRMGQGKYAAYQEGKFEFSKLSKEYDDDIYGKMRSETPLSELIGGGDE